MDLHGRPSRPPRTPIRPPRTDGGHAMFGESGPRYHANHEIERVKGLLTRPNRKQRFLNSSDVASYLGLRPISSLHVPVPLHLVFIGFKGDGNLGIDLPSSEISEWFDHLDHIIPHVYVPEAALECEEEGLCDGAAFSSASTVHSHLHFNLSCHAAELGDGVMESFERAARLFSRPVDPRRPGGAQQVDAELMEAFVDGLLEATGLRGGYTVVVLNPKWDPLRPKYGYRAGLSKTEVEFLDEDRGLLDIADAQPLPKTAKPPGKSHLTAAHTWRYNRPAQKFGVNERSVEGSMWISAADRLLDDFEGEQAKLKRLLPENLRTGDSLEETRVDFLRRVAASDKAGRERIRKSIHGASDSRGGSSGEEALMGPEEGCLVDTWVGRNRWVLIDLTAGAEDWGPSLDGSSPGTSRWGRSAMPSVESFFSSGGGSIGGAAGLDAGSGLSAADEDRRRQLPGGASSRDISDDAGARPAVAVLRAELDIMQRGWDIYCEGEDKTGEQCRDMETRMAQLEVEIAAASERRSEQDGSAVLAGLERRLFGEAPSRHSVDRSAEGKQRSQDLFLAQIGNLLSGAIRHAVVPPTSTWHSGDDVWRAPGEVHLPSKVDFTVYIVDDISVQPRNKKGPGMTDGIDVSALKEELEGLLLPGQAFSVSSLPLALTDDAALAVSVAVSLKPGVLRTPTSPVPVLSLDSRTLHDQIKHRVAPEASSAKHRGHSLNDSREVPVFVLQAARDVPVVIDGHLLAKSLPDMVLAVHNMGPASEGVHPAGVSCSKRLVSLCGTSSLRAALQAVVRHVGGALPPHLGYSPVHGEVTQDWAWSVGSHALSMTAPGWRLGQLTRDVVWRSSALRVLDASLHTSNAIVERLKQEATDLPGAYEAVTSGPRPLSALLLQAYVRLVDAWTASMKAMELLDFEDLVHRLREVETHTRELEEASLGMEEALHPGRCSRHPEDGGSGVLWGLAAVVAVVSALAAAAWAMLRALGYDWPGSLKPKIN